MGYYLLVTLLTALVMGGGGGLIGFLSDHNFWGAILGSAAYSIIGFVIGLFIGPLIAVIFRPTPELKVPDFIEPPLTG